MFNEGVPLFFGQTIIPQNRLVLIDGTTNEYVSLILATCSVTYISYVYNSTMYDILVLGNYGDLHYSTLPCAVYFLNPQSTVL